MTTLSAFEDFSDNLSQVDRLTEIHEDLTGDDRGRRFGVEILNKSAIVLVTACWESFVEDLASEGFEQLVVNAATSADIPVKVRVRASQSIRESKDECRVWDLADDNWRVVLRDYKSELIAPFNTPKTKNIDDLYDRLLDIQKLSSCWYWQKMSRQSASERLDKFVVLRGGIAHRVSAARAVTKKDVQDYRRFARQLAVKSANTVRTHLHGLMGTYLWDDLTF